MRFSIIIPAYNAEAHIANCVESVLMQDYHDYEVVIIDDGSTDKTKLICQSLQESYPSIKLFSQRNAGASAARNEGIRQSKGEYLLFLDSDDFWIQKNLLSTLDRTIKLTAPDLVLFGVRTVNNLSGKSKIRVAFSPDEIALLDSKNPAEQTDYLVSSNKFPSSAWSVASKSKLIKGQNIYFVEGIVAEDLDWVLTLFFQDIKVSAIEGIFYQYHKLRPGSVTSESGTKAVESILYIVEKWVPELNKDPLRDAALNRFLSFHFSTLFLSYYKLSKEKKREYKARISSYLPLLRTSNSRKLKYIGTILLIFGLHLGSLILSRLYHIQLRFRV